MAKKKNKKAKKKQTKPRALATKASSAEKEQKPRYDIPSVLKPKHTTERFTGNTQVSHVPFEIHAYTLPSALEALERQVKYGPAPSLPLVLHSVRNCLQDTFERIEKDFDLEEELLNKERPLMPVRNPDLPRPLLDKFRHLTMRLLANPREVDNVFNIPGMQHILFEMEILTTSVRECDDADDIIPEYFLDKSMTHFGYFICVMCRRTIEFKSSKWSGPCLERLIRLLRDRKSRFCMNFMVGDFLKDLYTNPDYRSKCLQYDILPGLFLDLVDVPSLCDTIFDFFFELTERNWYEASRETLEVAFDKVFLPWLDNHLYILPSADDAENKNMIVEFEEDLEHLLWLITANQHFFDFVLTTESPHPVFEVMRERYNACPEDILSFDRREALYKAVGNYKHAQTRRRGMNFEDVEQRMQQSSSTP